MGEYDGGLTADRQHTNLERVGFGVAALALIGTFAQAYILRDTERRSLRAYVAEVGIRLQCPSCGDANYREPTFGDTVVSSDLIVLTVKAAGQTPAYEVGLRHLDWQPYSKDMLYPSDDMPFETHQSLAKVIESRFTTMPGEPQDFLVAVRVSDFKAAREGKYHLRIYGNIDYKDVFGTPWTSEFCFVYQYANGADNFVRCPQHHADYQL
jgi:hypothetical protein